MEPILIQTPVGNSEILIQKEGLEYVRDYLKEHYSKSGVVIVTDDNLMKTYEEKLKNALPEAIILTVPAGEETKSLASVEKLIGQMIDKHLSRSTVLIGFGGGMVTDLAGFVASIYMRGITYIAVPTSLLGMVDAAIGGKTGVNLKIKNSVGTFYPAEKVVIDPIFLENLHGRELRTGLGEAIKYVGILDPSLEEDLSASTLDYEKIIYKSAKAKAEITNQDVKEGGLRKILNFGHTFGHAIESITNYEVMHGEAVSIGMVLANRVAQKLGKQETATGARIEALLKRHELPTELPEGVKLEDLATLMKKDKKVVGDKVTFIIVTELGTAEMLEMGVDELVELAR